jgi:ribosomal protein S18 acetylase RimI-like enzyme
MYTLRPATAADYDFLYQLHIASMKVYIAATWGWDEAWQLNYFNTHFDPAKRQIILVDETAAGAVSIEQREDEVYLALIELLPSHQGREIGTAVIQDIINAANAKGMRVSLHVLKANEPARRLYKRLGFTITAEEEVRYLMTHWPLEVQSAAHSK